MDYTELHQSCLPCIYMHWSHSFNRHSSPLNRCTNLIQTRTIIIASYKRIADSSVGQALKMAEEVILLDILGSSFGMRIALEEKGIEYEYKEENMLDKSPMLLQMNLVHKMVPVLIHNGKPICESLVILQYIDEVWKLKFPDLLPSDTYHLSQARFLADFVDKKICDSGKRILMTKGEVQEGAKKEMIECLKILEGELGDTLFRR